MKIKYRLESIAETEFKMNYEFDYSEFSYDKMQIQVGHEIKPIMDSDKIVIKAQASLLYGDSEILLASNTILMTFGLSPIKDVIIMKEDGTFTSQNPLVIDTFLIATMGTLRGVFMKNLKGTPIENVFIPLIPLEDFRREDK
jgi:hypothetical protein